MDDKSITAESIKNALVELNGTVAVAVEEPFKLTFPIKPIEYYNPPETYPSILRHEFTPIVLTPTVIPIPVLSDEPYELIEGILTKKEIKDYTMRVVRKFKVPLKRKNIKFAKKGSGTSRARTSFWGASGISFSDWMLQKGNIHFKYHTIIHEVCHIYSDLKHGRGTHHNHNFVIEEMKMHNAFGYRTYYPTREEGYICALKELSTGKYVFLKYNYQINDNGFPVLKKKERRTREWIEHAEHKFIADRIINIRENLKGAKIYRITISKSDRGWRRCSMHYKYKGKYDIFHNGVWNSEIKNIFKSNVSVEKQRAGLIYEWNSKNKDKYLKES